MSTEAKAWAFDEELSPKQLAQLVAAKASPANLNGRALAALLAPSQDLCRRLNEDGVPIYGLSSGFGSSSANRIGAAGRGELQRNLVRYHGCGVGPYLSPEESRAVLWLRTQCLMRGRSAVGPELVQALCALIRCDILPAIPEMGSVGASGDLTPLSYVAAVLQGDREAFVDGQLMPAAEALARFQLAPYALKDRDGLALMNGTSVMSAIACLAWDRADAVSRVACEVTAFLVELIDGYAEPFFAEGHAAKPQPGQVRAAAEILQLLSQPYRDRPKSAAFSEGLSRERRVDLQNKYSIRCAPHVIGVAFDALEISERMLRVEANSVTDNPVFFAEDGLAFHGGHFFGGHVAWAADSLKLALASVLNLLDRQVASLLEPGAPPVLSENLVARRDLGARSAWHHGFKAMQITLSALAAEAVREAAPMSVLSRPTEALNQDVVSMGTAAARSLREVVKKLEWGASIAMMAMVQASFIREDEDPGFAERLSPDLRALRFDIACHFPKLIEDRALDRDIEAVRKFLFKERRAQAKRC